MSCMLMLACDSMPKMTKTQQKRAYVAIKSKAKKLWFASGTYSVTTHQTAMTTKDYMAIERICDRYLKKF